jgi:hypothetical protein
MSSPAEQAVEAAIVMVVAAQERYFLATGGYYTGSPYGLTSYGWSKPAPWVTVQTSAVADDDYVVRVVHPDIASVEYVWRKKSVPQLETIACGG